MTTDPTLLYVVLFALSGIVLLTIALGVSVWLLFNKYKVLREKVLDDVRQDAKEYSKIIDEAKNQSLTILQTAQSASKEILSTTKSVDDSFVNELKTHIHDVLLKDQQTYQTAIESASTSLQESLKTLPSDITKVMASEVQKAGESLQKDIVGISSELKGKLETSFGEAENQIEIYKKTQMAEFDKNIFKVLQKVSQEVLRKELTIEEHEELIVKALERAKEEGLFK